MSNYEFTIALKPGVEKHPGAHALIIQKVEGDSWGAAVEDLERMYPEAIDKDDYTVTWRNIWPSGR